MRGIQEPKTVTWSDHKGLLSPRSLALSRIDQHGRVHYDLEDHIPPNDSKLEYILDICCGTGRSATLFHLKQNAKARVIGVDRDKSEAWVRKHLPQSYQSRFRFINCDVKDLTHELLQAHMQEFWPGSKVSQISHAHSSPPCQTMSRADRGLSGYRDEWGRPTHWRSIADDRALDATLRLFKRLVRDNPKMLVTVENPWNTVFPHLPSVQRLLSSRQWHLLTGSYCMCADQEDGQPWPQKDTLVLTYGVSPNFHLPLCEQKCSHLIPGTTRHKVVLCRNQHNHPQQTVMTDAMDKGLIPLGLFRRLYTAHHLYLAERTTNSHSNVCHLSTPAANAGTAGDGEKYDLGTLEEGESDDYLPALVLSEDSDSDSETDDVNLNDQDVDANDDYVEIDDSERAQPDSDAPTEAADRPSRSKEASDRHREDAHDVPRYNLRSSSKVKEHARNYPGLQKDGPRWDLSSMPPWSLIFVDEISFDFHVKGKRQHALLAYDLVTGGVRVKLSHKKSEHGLELDRIITNESLDKRDYKVTIVSDNCGSMNLVRDAALKRGLDWLPTPTYQPHLNVVEGYVRHFKEDVAASLLGAIKEDGPIDEQFIVHAIEYVAYTTERFSRERSRHTDFSSAFEKNVGVPPRNDRLVPFGAPGWAFIPEDLRKQRGDPKHKKAEPVLMLGYSHMYTREYKLLTTDGSVIRREQVNWDLTKECGIFPDQKSDSPPPALSDNIKDALLDIEQINQDSDMRDQIDCESTGIDPEESGIQFENVITISKKVHSKSGKSPADYILNRVTAIEGMTEEQAVKMRFWHPTEPNRLYRKDIKYDIATGWIKLVKRRKGECAHILTSCLLTEDHPEARQDRINNDFNTYHSINLAVKDMAWNKALKGPDRGKIEEAYNKEFTALLSTVMKEIDENHPERKAAERHATNCRVLLDIKRNGLYKVRFVIQGFREKLEVIDGPDFNYSSNVSGLSTVRQLFLKPKKPGRAKAQLDVSCAFLQSDMFPEDAPPRYLMCKDPITGKRRFFRQFGVIYGSCSAPVRWMNTLHPWIVEQGFVQGKNEPCVFYHKGMDTTVNSYVDDCGIEGPRENVEKFIKLISSRFDCKKPEYLEVDSPLDHLGMVFFEDEYATYLSMECYIRTALQRLDMENEKCSRYTSPITGPILDHSPIPPEKQAFCKTGCGMLGWLAGTGRPDLKLAHSRISQYMSQPNLGMYKAVRHAMLYCANTATHCLYQPHNEDAKWSMFSDSDHAGNAEPNNKRRSQLAFTAVYGKAAIAWGSKATHVRFDEASHGSEPASNKPYIFGAPKCHEQVNNLHPDVSSAAAEIYAASIALNECLYLSYMVDEMGQPMDLPIDIQVDNTTAIAFSKDRINRSKLKHIDCRQAWVEALRDDSICRLSKVDTKENIADLGTKILDTVRFQKLRDMIMIVKAAPAA